MTSLVPGAGPIFLPTNQPLGEPGCPGDVPLAAPGRVRRCASTRGPSPTLPTPCLAPPDRLPWPSLHRRRRVQSLRRDAVQWSSTRGCGAAGSAPHWQCGGQGFESPQLHKINKAAALQTCESAALFVPTHRSWFCMMWTVGSRAPASAATGSDQRSPHGWTGSGRPPTVGAFPARPLGHRQRSATSSSSTARSANYPTSNSASTTPSCTTPSTTPTTSSINPTSTAPQPPTPPFLHLRRVLGGDMVTMHLDSFTRVRDRATPAP
jgi:hypothetical protein